MFFANFTSPRARRRAILASAAVAALAAVGALGEGALTGSDIARATALSTTDLQGPSLPSLAPLVDRVKPAVVSIKVNASNDDSSTTESDQSDRVPSEIQQYLKRFGEQDSAPPKPVSIEGSGFFISSDWSEPAFATCAGGLLTETNNWRLTSGPSYEGFGRRPFAGGRSLTRGRRPKAS
jgi:S1-C subfamily serine protease